MDVKKLGPLGYLLIVNENLRFREEAGKAVNETKLLGALPGVLGAAGTPAIQERSFGV